MVWSGNDGHDKEIYLYKGSGTPIKITDNDYDDFEPQINANGWVVWNGWDGHDNDIYLYKGSGSPLQISKSDFSDYSPQINANGWVVWQGYDGPDFDIYLYKGSGSPINISNNDSNDASPQINAKGWVVWQGYDGHDKEIYLYKGSGSPSNISNNDSMDGFPQINANGWVVWQGYDGRDNEIYLYKGSGSPVNISDNDIYDGFPQINANGRLVWSGIDDSHYYEIFLATPSEGNKYLYRYSYGNGDYYQGYVYQAPSASGYSLGQKIYKKNELGLNGYYQILSVSPTSDTAKFGKVYVDYYKDAESAKGFAPLKKGQAVGTYLGSEQDYIVKYGVTAYKFGQGYIEADVGDKHLFRYYYTNGDYYQGYVYQALSATGYYPGQKIIKKNELGLNGYYQLLSASWTGDTAKYGKVFVDYYRDSESAKGFAPLKKGQAVGAAYLGSELDYILKAGVAAYLFGMGYIEADVGDKYLFRYSYANGDYYQGYVYQALSATGYYPGQKIIKKNELGLNGYYQLLSASWTGDTAKYGKVFVDYYRDSESAKGFAPLKKGQAVGTAYLGSELDSIVKAGVSAYQFGKGYYEADVGDKFLFRYYYTNGDYYQGYVYRALAATGYYPGQKIIKKNELGLNGYYSILSASWTGDTAKYGKVYITTYYDGDRTTPKTLAPLNNANPLGASYLTSEVGYIINTAKANHKFGQGYWEADE